MFTRMLSFAYPIVAARVKPVNVILLPYSRGIKTTHLVFDQGG